MKPKNVLLFLTLFTFAVACGGGESETSESTETQQETEATDDVRTIDIVGIDQMKFAVEEDADGITVGETTGPDGNLLLLESIEVAPGEEVRIRLTTRSQLPASAMSHNWVLLTLDADGAEYSKQAVKAKDEDYVPSDLSDQVLYHTELVGGGETTEVTFTAPEEPGEYEYLCSFPAHYAAGMKGLLVVKSEESGETTE